MVGSAVPKDEPMDEPSDLALVELARCGDAHAVQRLFERHYRAVYRLAYSWCGVREDAEDVAQEVFAKLVRILNGFRGDSAFKTWLYRVVVNAARDHRRRGAARASHEAAFVEQQRLNQAGGPGGNPGGAARLQAAVDLLPVKLREAVLLVYGEDLTHREAAEVLECMEATVSWRLFQARKRLKRSLELEP
jgi:RNA polymerase sigma-70 factor (ECF subfamily)